jgi:carbon-monoxide dehydrogenase small subunit
MDGKTIKSCITLAMKADGKEVLTVKGLEKTKIGQKLQESFVQYGAVQCGFCTAGMLMAARGYLDTNPEPNKVEIKKAISGNLCRCTGYKKIVEAIYEVAVENHRVEGDINV